MKDNELFLQEMSGVAPLQREQRIALEGKNKNVGDSSVQRRRDAAVADLGGDKNSLTAENIEPLDPWYVLDFKRPGIQNGVFRKLRQGRYELQASLDLHRMTVAIARGELFEFIADCYQLGLRTVMIIHGKGGTLPQSNSRSILKGCTNHWLRELDTVMAFHSAQVRDGGTGAVYVLLRKSEDSKRRNRERLTKGRET